jgi:L-ribulose-5-phosphate 3-epimerase
VGVTLLGFDLFTGAFVKVSIQSKELGVAAQKARFRNAHRLRNRLVSGNCWRACQRRSGIVVTIGTDRQRERRRSFDFVSDQQFDQKSCRHENRCYRTAACKSNFGGLPLPVRWLVECGPVSAFLFVFPSRSPTMNSDSSIDRRFFVAASALGAACALSGNANAVPALEKTGVITPPEGKRILLSCKLGMIAKESNGKALSLVERLKMAAEAGFDGVDFDEAGRYTVQEARDAVHQSGVFCHNAINHDHWRDTLTNAKPEARAKGVENIAHCLRVAHAIGGSGVLIVVGKGADGTPSECNERAKEEIKKLLPLAASLGQPILFENVWNQMHYDHDKPPEQMPNQFIDFVDSFNSPWVGMYYDIGNHWKYGQPREWLKAFGRRAVKLDVKGFSRAKNKFVDITSEEDDLPWDEVRKGLKEIDFSGWATAEVGGGNTERLTVVRKQMEKAFGIS